MNDTLLRRALIGNAVFSAACGADLLLFRDGLATWLGISAPIALTVLGVGLLAFAADIAHQASRPTLSPSRARMTTAQDLAWVAGTVVLLAGWPGVLGAGGKLAASGVAVAVAGFAIAQVVGLRRLRAAQS